MGATIMGMIASVTSVRRHDASKLSARPPSTMTSIATDSAMRWPTSARTAEQSWARRAESAPAVVVGESCQPTAWRIIDSNDAARTSRTTRSATRVSP